MDYHAVNAITLPDPYQMPFFEEILDSLAPARYLSKVDLNKGFHQIPIVHLKMPSCLHGGNLAI